MSSALFAAHCFCRYNKIEFGKNRKNAEAVELSKKAKTSKTGTKGSA
jgi:hypothetical protein